MKGMASHKAENETGLTWADFGLDNYHELPKVNPQRQSLAAWKEKERPTGAERQPRVK